MLYNNIYYDIQDYIHQNNILLLYKYVQSNVIDNYILDNNYFRFFSLIIDHTEVHKNNYIISLCNYIPIYNILFITTFIEYSILNKKNQLLFAIPKINEMYAYDSRIYYYMINIHELRNNLLYFCRKTNTILFKNDCRSFISYLFNSIENNAYDRCKFILDNLHHFINLNDIVFPNFINQLFLKRVETLLIFNIIRSSKDCICHDKYHRSDLEKYLINIGANYCLECHQPISR